jgi:hypothetical protein
MQQSTSLEANRLSVKKIPTFYRTQRFIVALTSARHLPLYWARSIQYITPTSHFLKIDLNIILPSTPGSTKWSVTYITVYKHRLSNCYNTRYRSKFQHVATSIQSRKSALLCQARTVLISKVTITITTVGILLMIVSAGREQIAVRCRSRSAHCGTFKWKVSM